jgi:hypothetical protein
MRIQICAGKFGVLFSCRTLTVMHLLDAWGSGEIPLPGCPRITGAWWG